MTDNTQELDEIFNDDYFDVKVAKQAILDWHNKQIDQATDSVEAMVADIAFKEGINHVTMGGEWLHRDEVNKQIESVLDRLQQRTVKGDIILGESVYTAITRAIEAERNKLKEGSNDKDS